MKLLKYVFLMLPFLFSYSTLPEKTALPDKDFEALNQCRLEYLHNEGHKADKPKKITDLNSTQYYSSDYTVEEIKGLSLPVGAIRNEAYVRIFKYYEGRSKKQIIKCQSEENSKLHEFKWFVGLDITAKVYYKNKKSFLNNTNFGSISSAIAQYNNGKKNMSIEFEVYSIGATGPSLIGKTSAIKKYLSKDGSKEYNVLQNLITEYENSLSNTDTNIDPDFQFINKH